MVQARKNILLLEDIEKYGQKKAFSLWENPDQYFAVAMERKEREEAERKRQQEIAQKRLKTKKQAISSYIDSRPDLSQAMDEVVQIGAEREAVDSFLRGNMFGHLCETGRNNTFYQSKTCLSEWEVVRGEREAISSAWMLLTKNSGTGSLVYSARMPVSLQRSWMTVSPGLRQTRL